ncbi:MAG TPA: PD-(D/E)XK nuclease family protein [Mycobacteriales bacterium]|jgi:RecB family exonuclease
MQQLGFDGMPTRLFSATPSRLASYEDCPRRYRMTYLDRPAPPRGLPWAHNSLGASVHNALRAWWSLPRERRTPAAAVGLLRSGWLTDGYRDRAQSDETLTRASGWVESYVETLDPDDEPVGVERTVGTRTETLAVSGRIDRLDERDGELVVVDYKTGRSPLSTDDARGSRALALYALAAERTLRRSCRTVELHHLPTGAVHAHTHTEESLARHVRRAEDTAADIVAATDRLGAGAAPDEAFPPAPGPRCSWCDFRRHCAEGRAASTEKDPWVAVAG